MKIFFYSVLYNSKWDVHKISGVKQPLCFILYIYKISALYYIALWLLLSALDTDTVSHYS